MALTDTFIKQTKWTGTTKNGDKHHDGHGLYLHVKESGKYWCMAYRVCFEWLEGHAYRVEIVDYH